ncbi:MAG: hypothetical protein JWM87_215 [Candidatus Eremiobacteraeota bacterium]|nr:hypothetical protein [Candidatus Eremiobacteraeota bacterium]
MEAFAEVARTLRQVAHRRPRRPKAVRGPKRRAFAVDGGEPVDAARALAGAALYEYGYRPVHRKRIADAPATEDRSWYFAFDPRRDGVRDRGAGSELTFTHAMMQAILCEKRFVQCTIDGALFSSDLTDVARERWQSADESALWETRRPDVSARAVRASNHRLNGRPLDVEIAVTSHARAHDGFAELIQSERACLELCVVRDAKREADPNALEGYLRSALLGGIFPARWIVAPDGARAVLRPVHDVHRLLAKQRARARDDLARAQIELAAAAEQLLPPEPLAEEEEFRDRAALARVDAEWEALLEFAESYDGARETALLVPLVAEVVAPALRDPRLRTRTQRLVRIRAQVRARFAPRRSGFMKRVEALERALYAPMSHVAARRADAASRAAVATASIRQAEGHRRRVEAYQARLDELDAAGARELLFAPGSSIRATIAFEHLRRFGDGSEEPHCSALTA